MSATIYEIYILRWFVPKVITSKEQKILINQDIRRIKRVFNQSQSHDGNGMLSRICQASMSLERNKEERKIYIYTKNALTSRKILFSMNGLRIYRWKKVAVNWEYLKKKEKSTILPN